MSEAIGRGKIGLLLGAMLLISVVTGGAEEGSYSIELSGRKTWTVQYGFGDALGLAAAGLAPGQLTLGQTLAVDVTGQALSILSIEAHFDDQQASHLQSLALFLDTERLDGVLGDFVAEGYSGFAAYGKKMKGLRLEYALGEALLTGIASTLEGISESRTFIGQKAHDEVTFSAYTAADPPKARPYKREIEGLYAYPLSTYYVKEFSDLRLRFDPSPALRGVLTEYGLGYLVEELFGEPSFPLEEYEFRVIGDETQILVLSERAFDLVRDRLEEAIARYNDTNGLQGEAAKEYPFSRDTVYERGFLAAVAEDVRIAVDAEEHPILDAVRRRFYDLGRTRISVGSLSVALSPDGVRFESIEGPAYRDYSVKLFEAAGVLEVDFPDAFFTDQCAIRVAFDYSVSGGVFALGLSVIPGSDRVFVNEALLARDVDYMLDYETGMLVLAVEIEETDVIRVDYERFAGGALGGAAEYATHFYGLALDWPVSETLTIQAGLLRSAEDPDSVSDPQAVGTMPNRHTVASLSGEVSFAGFDADFFVGYSEDRFPFDDNARVPKRNEVLAVASAKGYVLLGHQAGLTAYRSGEWTSYGPGQGLAGRSVRALAAGGGALFVGTNAGLSVVELEGVSPLDRIINWTSYYADDEVGLPDGSVRSLFYADETLWVGTDSGLVSVRVAEMDAPEKWLRHEQLGGVAVTSLAGGGDVLYAATDAGLYRYEGREGGWELFDGTEGLAVRDLLLRNGMLYVASDRGLRTYEDGIGSGWLVVGQAVRAVEGFDGRVAYGTGAGLYDVEGGKLLVSDVAVTALGAVDSALWIGTRADADYDLTLWTYAAAATERHGSEETGIDGRDPVGFVDADPKEHTRAGFVERASFHRVADGFTLSGSFENVSPSYRGIGSRSRWDATDWQLAASWKLGENANLSVSHGYDILGAQSGRLESTSATDLSLQWSFGPVVAVSAHLDTTDGASRRTGSDSALASYRVSVRDTLFAERLTLGIGWSDGYAWADVSAVPRRDTVLSLNAGATILPAWSAKLDWARPIRQAEGSWQGSEQLTFRTDGSMDIPWAKLSLGYALGWGRSLPGGGGSRSHEAELNATLIPFEMTGWRLSPALGLSATTDEASLDLDGRVTARGQREGLSIQGTLRGGLTGIGTRVVRESEKLSVSVSHTGMVSLRPSVTYAFDRQVAAYELRRQETTSHSLTGRVTWMPGSGHRDELSVSVSSKGGAEARQVTARLNNVYRFELSSWRDTWWPERVDQPAYPLVDLRLETDANYQWSGGEPKIDASTTGWLNAAFSEAWSGSLRASFLGGRAATGAFYHSLRLELAVVIDF